MKITFIGSANYATILDEQASRLCQGSLDAEALIERVSHDILHAESSITVILRLDRWLRQLLYLTQLQDKQHEQRRQLVVQAIYKGLIRVLGGTPLHAHLPEQMKACLRDLQELDRQAVVDQHDEQQDDSAAFLGHRFDEDEVDDVDNNNDHAKTESKGVIQSMSSTVVQAGNKQGSAFHRALSQLQAQLCEPSDQATNIMINAMRCWLVDSLRSMSSCDLSSDGPSVKIEAYQASWQPLTEMTVRLRALVHFSIERTNSDAEKWLMLDSWWAVLKALHKTGDYYLLNVLASVPAIQGYLPSTSSSRYVPVESTQENLRLFINRLWGKSLTPVQGLYKAMADVKRHCQDIASAQSKINHRSNTLADLTSELKDLQITLYERRQELIITRQSSSRCQSWLLRVNAILTKVQLYQSSPTVNEFNQLWGDRKQLITDIQQEVVIKPATKKLGIALAEIKRVKQLYIAQFDVLNLSAPLVNCLNTDEQWPQVELRAEPAPLYSRAFLDAFMPNAALTRLILANDFPLTCTGSSVDYRDLSNCLLTLMAYDNSQIDQQDDLVTVLRKIVVADFEPWQLAYIADEGYSDNIVLQAIGEEETSEENQVGNDNNNNNSVTQAIDKNKARSGSELSIKSNSSSRSADNSRANPNHSSSNQNLIHNSSSTPSLNSVGISAGDNLLLVAKQVEIFEQSYGSNFKKLDFYKNYLNKDGDYSTLTPSRKYNLSVLNLNTHKSLKEGYAAEAERWQKICESCKSLGYDQAKTAESIKVLDSHLLKRLAVFEFIYELLESLRTDWQKRVTPSYLKQVTNVATVKIIEVESHANKNPTSRSHQAWQLAEDYTNAVDQSTANGNHQWLASRIQQLIKGVHGSKVAAALDVNARLKNSGLPGLAAEVDSAIPFENDPIVTANTLSNSDTQSSGTNSGNISTYPSHSSGHGTSSTSSPVLIGSDGNNIGLELSPKVTRKEVGTPVNV